jgi:hypothetical protein
VFGKSCEIGIFNAADRSRFLRQRAKPSAAIHALPFVEQFTACCVESLRSFNRATGYFGNVLRTGHRDMLLYFFEAPPNISSIPNWVFGGSLPEG